MFHQKLREYEKQTGIHLLENEMNRLSRIELVYTTNYIFIKYLKYKNKDIEEYKWYLEERNKNDTIYRTRDVDSKSKLEMLLKHSVSLYNAYKADVDVNQSDEFLNLKRLIDDQYDSDNKKPKDGKDYWVNKFAIIIITNVNSASFCICKSNYFFT